MGRDSAATAAGKPAVETTARPKVGDVIKCETFINGWRDMVRRGDKLVPENGPVRVSKRAPIGKHETFRDERRAGAEFVVEESSLSETSISWETHHRSGYGGIFEHDETHEEHAWKVVARRLRPDGSYDPNGELISFLTFCSREAYEASCRQYEQSSVMKSGFYYGPMTVDEPVTVVRRLKRAVYFA